MKARAVFLDRDGILNRATVINGLPKSPASIPEIEILPGAKEAIRILKSKGYLTVVVTNQPDVARKKVSEARAREINDKIAAEFGIENVYTCFHSDEDKCMCRKPLPGLIVQASQELNIDLNRSFLVGDRWKDVEAAHAVGIRAYFVDYSYSEKYPREPFIKVSSLYEAAQSIVRGDRFEPDCR